jgi:hypothetical protein
MSMREGLGQRQRMPAALAAHYIDVDELSLAQLLALTRDYADLVHFAENGADLPNTGTWKPYFSGDETMVMADILATRLQHARADFDVLLENALAGRAVPGEPVLREQLPTYALYQLTKKLDHWSEVLHLQGSGEGRDLSALMVGLRARMTPQLDKVVQFYDSRQPWDERITLAELIEAMGATLDLRGGSEDADNLVRATLKSWYNQLIKGVDMAQRGAAQRIVRSLASGQHDPGIGLLLAFVQLYQLAQQQINGLTERHRDFYYDQVLRMRAHGPVGDATFLVFQPSGAGNSVPIPAGTAFLAPFDKQQPELTYASEYAMVVGDAQVAASYTLFCERNRLTSPENGLHEVLHGQRKHYPTACRVNALPLLAPEAALDLLKLKLTPQPLFGAPRAGAAAVPGQDARIGFALASNVLLMHEGVRVVDVTLHLGADAHPQAGDSGATLGLRMGCLAGLMKGSDGEVQYKVLRRLFKLSISGAAGWIAIGDYSAEFTAGAHCDVLRLCFKLGAEVAPVVPYDGALHGESLASACPLLRFELNGEGYLYPYGLLRGLPLIKADIDVKVKGHRVLVLQNNIGALPASGPFLPFGPLPAPGSYLIVGSAEAACKRLTDAELVLEWGALPGAAGGLPGYYGSYGDDYVFVDVQCALSVLADGRWQPSGAQARPMHTLFARQLGTRRDPIAPVEKVRLKALLHLARPLAAPAPDQDMAYSPSSTGGFFKLTLATPEFAFGHRDYPFALAAALTYNSQPGNRRRLRALPNPPYAPLVDALSLNYAASASITPAPAASGEALLRLHPLGWELAQAGGDASADLLLPQIDYSGSLFLGLRAADLAAPLTLFFQLGEDALPMSAAHGGNLHWAYLADNQWRPFAPSAVRADSTHALLRPGVVTLKVPRDINLNNSVMPAGLFWLRLSCELELEKYATLYAVHAQAVQVFRQTDAGTPGAAPAYIPAATIKRPRQAIAGLGRITQINASFGGRLAEQRDQLRRRSAERLKHKGRAITPDDYERLILERFPDIDRVKCFPNLSQSKRPDGGTCAGHVLIVGVPPYRSSGHLALLPSLNGDQIAEIRKFVQERVSPAVTLEVVNPVYQQIQVRCKVTLAPDKDEGLVVNLLDQLVSDFISPWSGTGNTSHFGWCIRNHDVESLILAHEGVLGVSEFSMLSVSDQVDERFTLTDTAVPQKLPPEPPAGQRPAFRPAPSIEPAYPWSIAVPIRRHVILVAGSAQSQSQPLSAQATRTGIGKLEIGSTFIIAPGAVDDEKK